jgi:adenine-specific DNA-methyltransferase
MAKLPKPPTTPAARPVEAFTHGASRRNIPTAELQSLAQQAEEAAPIPPARYPRANPLAEGTTRPRDADRDPQLLWNGMTIRITEAQKRELAETGTLTLGEAQLVWRGKDTQDWSDLVVQPPPIYVQEKIHPKAIIADLQRQSAKSRAAETGPDLFADFNGLPDPEARLEFYQHDQHWSNRMILGDSLQVMSSLAEREGLRGKVQCIYFDPPYGIKFSSNWQVSTQNRDVKDGKQTDISREPEQVKAFRDTWKGGIHSYLTYLRDRLTVARELLTESGSIFVQIGDENVHRVRAIMDEVFGAENLISQIAFKKTAAQSADNLPNTLDYIICFSKSKIELKYRQMYRLKIAGGPAAGKYTYLEERFVLRKASDSELEVMDDGGKLKLIAVDTLVSQRPPGNFPVEFQGVTYVPKNGYWKTGVKGFENLIKAGRTLPGGKALSVCLITA